MKRSTTRRNGLAGGEAAAVLIAELGDLRRFQHPRHLMAFLGLVPREHTSGDSRHLGGITKAGTCSAAG